MKYCKNCGEKVEIETKFCSNCGVEQDLNKETIIYGNDSSINIEKIVKETKANFSKNNKNGRIYELTGWASVVISLFLVPIFFGAIGVIMGYLYRYDNEKHGTIIIIASIAGSIFGMLLGFSSAGY
ncbi:hypothetical protein IV75_GL001626 [Carnobacterium maltaromaticum]|uniref:zinc-ribbon domain-containing protein n=1 Tax=Carnobacterium maltaromaticum TaxID=2751 RepID=UPI0007054754|nr:zinc ribbon domain-containing protein [Carnobacterium maltaromaticum]KRN85912.1 hypothetical protein IV75_GL001626 [Carnobacterium maltaromaticum]